MMESGDKYCCLFLRDNMDTENPYNHIAIQLELINTAINKSIVFKKNVSIEVDICQDLEFFERTDNPQIDYFIDYLDDDTSAIVIPETKINEVVDLCIQGFLKIYQGRIGVLQNEIYSLLQEAVKEELDDKSEIKSEPEGEAGAIKSECVICSKIALSGNTLVNGNVYHDRCYQGLLKNINKIGNDLDFFHSEINKSRSSLDKSIKLISKSRGAINKLRAAIGVSYIDEKSIWQERKRIENEISEREQHTNLLEKELVGFKGQVKKLYDSWPGYPPDWEERGDEIRSEREECEACGESWNLHVHHRIGIRNGGNHTSENLVLLCEECHGEIHHQDFSGKEFEFSERISSFGKKLKLINHAISQNKKILFNYRKFDGEKSKRTICPELTKRVGRSLCVSGFCYLRNEERIFAIKRMRNLNIVD